MNSPSSVEGTTQTDLFRLPGGESVMVRAISPQDADRLQAYMRNLSGPTRRNRFLGAVSELTPKELEPQSQRCEIALSVTDAWQRKGLGTLLLSHMECRAMLLGARYLVGDVLRTNDAMRGLARKAGFAIRGPFKDARLIEIVKDLSSPPTGLSCREQFSELALIAA